MSVLTDPFHVVRSLKQGHYYFLPALEEQGFASIRRLPVSIRIILESLLRHCDGHHVKKEDVIQLAHWQATDPAEGDVPFWEGLE